MKFAYRIAFAALALLVAISTPCQTTTTATSPQNLNHFSISGSAAGFTGANGGSQTVSVSGISYQFTSRVSFGYQNINIPGVTTYDFGTAQYATPLSSLLGKSLTSKVTFDATKVTVSFMGGAGEVMTPAKHIAETGGIFISYPMASSASGSFTVGPVVGLQVVHSPGVTGYIITPSSAAISAGLSVTF